MRPTGVDQGKREVFQRRLLRWFRKNGRDLPWRRTRDPYRILVSEVMLQQTQVDRVLDYYPRFLRRYPTVQALAAAHPSGVREAWDGLGYYARARNLHQSARTIVGSYDGRFPRTEAEVRALPGVGRYTAGALLSFAFQADAPILDTNVRRVLERVFVRRRSPNRGRMDRRLWGLSEAVLPPGEGWAFNQALMDFGATVCTARRPRCATCCMRDICAAYPRLVRQGKFSE